MRFRGFHRDDGFFTAKCAKDTKKGIFTAEALRRGGAVGGVGKSKTHHS